jgi:hypothetical protein
MNLVNSQFAIAFLIETLSGQIFRERRKAEQETFHQKLLPLGPHTCNLGCS